MTPNKIITKIPAGALFTITNGVYSSYRVEGLFRALAKIDAEALRAEHVSINLAQTRKADDLDPVKFVAWLMLKGLLEPMESWELHLEDYGSTDDMYVSKVDWNTP